MFTNPFKFAEDVFCAVAEDVFVEVVDLSRIFDNTLVKDNIKRTYDATAMTNVSFYSLEKSVFHNIKANFIHKNRKPNPL